MKNLFILFSIIALFSCSKNEDKKGEEDFIVKNLDIIVPKGSNITPKIKLHTVEKQNINFEFSTTGIVRAIPNHYAEIASPFPGRIAHSYVKLGQRMEVGSPIFSVISSDYYEAQRELLDAVSELQFAEKDFQRQKDLVEHGVGVQRDLEEAQAEYLVKKNALNSATAAMKIYGNTKASVGEPLIIRSPIEGVVISNTIVNGQFLKEDAEPVAIVAELSKVWIVGEVKEKDIQFVKEGDMVSVKVAAYQDKIISGKVFHIDETVNETTRSIDVLVECPNPKKLLKPGMYASMIFSDKPKEGILIPSQSVMQSVDSEYVVVKVGDGTYRKRNIETNNSSKGDFVSISKGLEPGEEIISEGAIYLINAIK